MEHPDADPIEAWSVNSGIYKRKDKEEENSEYDNDALDIDGTDREIQQYTTSDINNDYGNDFGNRYNDNVSDSDDSVSIDEQDYGKIAFIICFIYIYQRHNYVMGIAIYHLYSRFQ